LKGAAGLALAAAVAAGAASGAGPEGSAQGPAAMDSTVVIAVTAKSALPAGTVLLGKGKGLAWGQVPVKAASSSATSSAAASTASRAPQAHLLWLDLASYQASVAGLGKPAQAAAVAKRAAVPGEVLSNLAEDLAREAGRLAALGKGPADNLNAVFNAGWRLGRVKGTPTEELTLALDDRAALDGYEAAAAALALSPARTRPDSALSARTREALVRAAVALGDSALGRAPYRPRLLQGYYLSGKRTLLQDAIDRKEIDSEKLPRGRLVLISGAQAESIRDIEKPLPVFLVPEDYSRSLLLDTPAQREARIAALARQGGPGLAEYIEASIRKRLDLLARMDEALRPGGSLPAAAQDALRDAFRAERERLRAELVEASVRTNANAAGGTGADAAFHARIDLLAGRLDLLARFAAAAGLKDIAAWAEHGAAALNKGASNESASRP